MRRRAGPRDTDPLKSLREPLLKDYDQEEADKEDEKKSCQASHLFPEELSSDAGVLVWQQVLGIWLSHCTSWFRTVFQGASAVIFTSVAGLLLQRSKSSSQLGSAPPLPLTEDAKESLKQLKLRLDVPFDSKNPEHVGILQSLWREVFPGDELPVEEGEEGEVMLVSEKWKEMGWQGKNPVTDLRGAGLMALQNILYHAQKYPTSFRRLMNKEEGKRAAWEYPFAAAGVNITVTLIQLLDLKSENPSSPAGRQFLRLLVANKSAFDDLYCVFYEMLDSEWVATGASYMDFNGVLKAVKGKLEQQLSKSSIISMSDLSGFSKLS